MFSLNIKKCLTTGPLKTNVPSMQALANINTDCVCVCVCVCGVCSVFTSNTLSDSDAPFSSCFVIYKVQSLLNCSQTHRSRPDNIKHVWCLRCRSWVITSVFTPSWCTASNERGIPEQLLLLPSNTVVLKAKVSCFSQELNISPPGLAEE